MRDAGRGVRRELVGRGGGDEDEVERRRARRPRRSSARCGRPRWRGRSGARTASAWRRSRMPVRGRSSSSSMPRRSAIGPFETTRLGQAGGRGRATPRGARSGRAVARGRWARQRLRSACSAALALVTGATRLRARTLPGPASTKSLGAGRVHREEGLAPAHGAGQRGGELGAHVGRTARRSSTSRRGSAARRARPRRARRGTARRPAAIDGRVERAGDGRAASRACRTRARPPRPRRSSSRSPESTTWPGALSLATVRPAASAIAARRRRRRRRAARASSRVVVGLGHQPAAQHDEARARRRASGRRRRRARRARRASGRRRIAGSTSRRRVQPATEAQKMAGCAKRVLSSTRSKGSSPTSSMTRSSRSGQRTRDVVAHVGGL